MIVLPLQDDTANQQFSTLQDNDYYVITLRTVFNVTLITVVRNGTTVVQSSRCPPSQYLLLKYQEAGRGNFAFSNANDEYPYYTDFNKTTFLNYYTPEEMAAVRGAS